jgi:hypothetical protein
MENLLTELDRIILRLEELGLKFSAALVRIAHLDLQMRVHNISAEEVDLLSFAVNAVEQERYRRIGQQTDVDNR